MQISNTKKILIASVILSLIAAVGYGLLVRWIFQQRAASVALAEELEYEINREERVRSLGHLLSDVTKDIEFMNGRFLTEKDTAVVEYIKMLEGLVKHTRVELDIVSVSVDRNSVDELATLMVSLSAIGSENAVTTLVKLIESLPTITVIDSMNVGVQEDNKWNVSFVLRVLISV